MNTMIITNLVYSVLNFLPYAAILIYAFGLKLRYGKWGTRMFLLLSTIVQMLLRCVLLFSNGAFGANLQTIVAMVINVLFCFWAIRDGFGRILFNILMMANVASTVAVVAKFLEGRFFSSYVLQGHAWTFCFCLFLVQCFALPLLYWYVRRYSTKEIREEVEEKDWRYMWLTPAVFYLIWYYVLYCMGVPAAQAAMKPQMALFAVAYLGGQLVTYSLASDVLTNQVHVRKMAEQMSHLEMEQVQYKAIQEHLDEMRKMRHDMRHHMRVFHEYLDRSDYEGLRSYIQEYSHAVEEVPRMVYSSNITLNMMILHLVQRCKEDEIECEVNLALPENLGLSKVEITVLFGNLFENAYQACLGQTTGKRRIFLKGNMQNDQVVLVLDNTCENAVKQDAEGRFLSTKHEGYGIGTKSIREIVQRHQGYYHAGVEAGMFCTSIMYRIV